MNLSYFLAETVKKDRGCGIPYPGTLKMNLSYCILAEAVKKELETVGSHIQVRYR